MNACVPHALLFRMVKLYYMFFFTSVYALFFCLSSLNKAFIKPQVCEEHSNYSGGPSSKKKKILVYMEIILFLENQIYPAKIIGRQIKRYLSVDIKIIWQWWLL